MKMHCKTLNIRYFQRHAYFGAFSLFNVKLS